MGTFWSNVRGQMARFLRGNRSTNHEDLNIIVIFVLSAQTI